MSAARSATDSEPEAGLELVGAAIAAAALGEALDGLGASLAEATSREGTDPHVNNQQLVDTHHLRM